MARIENEALSAARREAPPAAGGVEDPGAGDDGLFDGEDDPLADLPYRDAEPDDEDEPVAEAPVHHHEPEPEAVYEPSSPAWSPSSPSPSPSRRREPEEDDPQATQQFSLEELEAQAARDDAAPGQPRPRTPAADAPPAEPGEEDVLEETPEFLQETPEHDRLWFEQKPPKDFDF